MKILMVTNIYPTKKQPNRGIFVKTQIDSIKKEGHQVDLLHIDTQKGIIEYLKYALKIFKKSCRSDYEIIHAHYGFSGMISRIQFGFPLVISFCGDDLLGTPDISGNKTFISKIWIGINQIIALFASAVIVKSEEMKDILIRKKNVFVIPNGVDFNAFYPINKVEAKKLLTLKTERKYFLFPSDPDVIRKCFPVVDEAVNLLKQQQVDCELLVLKNQSPEKVPIIMNACDAMVLASFWEGSPNVVKEAMACNLPIVTVAVGDTKEIIKGCEGCYLTERNAKEIAEHLKIIIDSGKRTNGRQIIKNLEIQKVAGRVIDVYNKILRK